MPRRPLTTRSSLPGRPKLVATAVLIALGTLPVHAQQTLEPSSMKTLESVVVRGDIAYRDRTEDTAPTLTYDQEYFQRFEPSTAGDMVKRVSSATFVSDVLEYDAVQLRGLAPAYTQVLLNGKKVPGGADDRSFWLDRIPAEMIDRVEVIRSPSANRSGDAMAGSINIVLRDAYEFDGSYIRLGGIHYDDGTTQPTLGLVSSGEWLGGRILVSLNVQDRYNPKKKRSDRWKEPGGDFDSYENQTDTRDGKDYSANASYAAEVGPGRLKLESFYVQTDRTQKEKSNEVVYDNGALDENNRVPGRTDVDQRNWGIGAEYKFDMAGGQTEIGLQHARFQDKNTEREEEHVYTRNGNVWEWEESEGEKTGFNSHDTENSLKLAHKRPIGSAEMEFGLDYQAKDRLTKYSQYEWEDEVDVGHTTPGPVDYEKAGVIESTITENRADPYLMFSGKTGALAWEAGLRYETTTTTIKSEEEGKFNNDYQTALPSLNLKYDLDELNRVSFSVGKTVRRPNFNFLLPDLLDGEYGDNDFVGNPKLNPETAHGVDLGFERRLGKRGIVGVNFFYRSVQDLIELVNTGESSEAWEELVDDDYAGDESAALAAGESKSYVYKAKNVGDGKVYGIEFDLSTPLTVIGLPDTGIFFNYSWLDSEVKDFMGTRRFNNQADSLYNVGFIQNLPSLASSFGASYRKQGQAKSRVLGEEVTTTYGGDLEVFVEKRVGKSLSLRLSGNNLLDAEKKEVFHKFNTQEEQESRDYDEYEVEKEKAGPRIQFVARYAF
ncbi:TonB-dependent receptor plug domain-containing protein [Hylemonella sp. W303a]|uniref:TonB-dependent receptor plug domain-containing protein n=1 Tax=Hylemonella sp. W303a TaxID=3389873 RepID=UPI00396B3E16